MPLSAAFLGAPPLSGAHLLLSAGSPGRAAGFVVVYSGLLLMGAVAGWSYAWWAFRRTNLSPWVAYRAAAGAVGLLLVGTFAGLRAGAFWIPLVLLPIAFATVIAASQGRRYRGSSLGAAGELRQHEQSRVGLRQWLAQRGARAEARDKGIKEYIGTQGQLVREQPLTIPTMALDHAGRLLVGAGAGLHMLIVGRTRRGKTRTMERIMWHRAVVQGAGLLVIDGKPDKHLPGFLARVAKETGRPVYTLSRHEGAAYNPLAGKDPSGAAEMAVAGLPDDGPSWYRLGALHHFDLVAKVLHQKFGTLNLPLLVAASPMAALGLVLHWAKGTDLEDRVRDHADVLKRSKGRQEVVDGAVLKLQTVVQRGWERTFTPMGDEGGEGVALSLLEALSSKAIVLVQAVGASGKQDVETVIAMLLADLNEACQHLDVEAREDGAPGDDWVAVLDEFSSYISEQGLEQLVGLYQRAGSAGGQIIMGTQSVADLRAFTENDDMTESLAENLSTLIIHAQQTSGSREWVSMYAGTVEMWAHTDSTTGHGIATEGSGSARRAREFTIRPDDISTLGVGEVYVVTPPAAPVRGQVALVDYEPASFLPDDIDPTAMVPSGAATLSGASNRGTLDDDDAMDAPEGYDESGEPSPEPEPDGAPDDDDVPEEAFDDGAPEDHDVPAAAFAGEGDEDDDQADDDGIPAGAFDDDDESGSQDEDAVEHVSTATDSSVANQSVASHTLGAVVVSPDAPVREVDPW